MAHNFGNYLVQQQELIDGRAWVQIPMEAVTIAGVDRFSWLNNITTAPMLALRQNASDSTQLSSAQSASETTRGAYRDTRHEGLETLILDAAGHIMFACAAADDGERTWLLVDTGVSAALADFLRGMQFMARVEVEVTPIAAVGVMLPSADLPSELIAQAAVVWEDPWPQVSAGGAHYGVPDSEHPAAPHTRTLLISELPKAAEPPEVSDLPDSEVSKRGELHDVPSAMREALVATGYSEASHAAWEALRIADWRPRPTLEVIDTRVLPHELDWLRTAVWLNKGCFPGQESVAKIVNMGKPPRRLAFLYAEGPEGELPAAGTKLVFLDGDSHSGSANTAESAPASIAGVVTSIGRHYELGPIALAIVKRTVPGDAILEFADNSGFIATQELIVFPKGRSSASPQEIPGEKLRKARAALSSEEKPERRR